jgi:hypothetical protein
MKRIFALILVAISLFAFASCSLFGETGTTTLEETDLTTTTSTTSNPTTAENTTVTIPITTSRPDYSNLPVHTPGSIKLEDALFQEFTFTPHYRLIYYTLSGVFLDIVDEKDSDKWITEFNKQWEIGQDSTKMITAEFVKYFNIPKEMFIKKFEEQKQLLIEQGCNVNSEEWELPNADIIYTFDDEIINNYYRRQ